MKQLQSLLRRFPLLIASLVLCIVALFSDYEKKSDGLGLENMLPVMEHEDGFTHGKVKVRKVFDGDTVNVQDANGKIYKVRLYGIDAPEKGQPFANKAREFVYYETKNKEFTIEIHDVDKYKRQVVVLYDENGISLQEKILENGYAWVHPYFCHDVMICPGYEKAEYEAREEKLGLWQERSPEAPWEFKKRNR